jgi:hypothetical protein
MQQEQQEKRGEIIGEMVKRREPMADGRRYIIYYTFEKHENESSEIRPESEIKENV